MHYNSFSPFIHQILSLVIILIAVAIFAKANIYYDKEPKQNLIFIAAGFLFGAIFEFIHTSYAFVFDFVNHETIYQNFEFVYVIISRFITSVSVLISSFYIRLNNGNNVRAYRKKIYFYYSLLSVAIIVISESFRYIAPAGARLLSHELILTNPSVEVINNALFILAAFVYTDIRRTRKVQMFSFFTLGLMFLGFGQIYLFSVEYTNSLYRLYIHFSRIIAYCFIFIGLSDAKLSPELFSLRQKLLVYPAGLLLLLYIFLNTFSIIFYGSIVFDSFKYLFLVYYIISVTFSYYVSIKLVEPLDKLISDLKSLVPGTKPINININTNDEIGLLSDKINQYAHEDWVHIQEKQKSIEKQVILGEILSTLKFSNSLNDVICYFLKKIMTVFKVKKVIYVEYSEQEQDKFVFRFECNSDESITVPVIKKLPISINDLFVNSINDLKHFELKNFKSNDSGRKLELFINDDNIQSLIGYPLVKQGVKNNILGFLLLGFDTNETLSEEELALLDEISNCFIGVIWEIKKRDEIDELRNTFILTLAHDLQVPLVGERKALEFILSMPAGQFLDTYKELIAETIKSNIELSTFLKALVDSYNYELNRKILNYSELNISTIIDEVVSDLREFAASKSIQIVNNLDDDIPQIFVDSEEIRKVFLTILSNAITFTQNKGKVIITNSFKNGYLKICIIDNGIGISPEIRKRLFKRYEMTLATDRKIGSGLNTYLAKQIVEAHNGYIWIESEFGEGTSFCISLPLK